MKSSEEYYRRKRLILANLERLEKKVEKHAKSYDDYERLRFIMMEKAKQKKSILKNFYKIELFGRDQQFKQEENEQSSENQNEQ